MNLKLNGKKALVTGSTAGIGLEIARSLFREGAKVIVNGRTQARVDDAVREVQSLDPTRRDDVLGIVADLGSQAGVEALVRKVSEVDVLVNNLGVYKAQPLEDIREADWKHMFDVNVMSGAVLSQTYLKGMRARDWGRILFIASEAGVNIPADMIPYGVSKAAQIALARGLAETTAGTGVTVNSVLPGPTYSEGINQFLENLPLDQGQDRVALEKEFLLKLRPTSLLRRFATAEEVANMVTYLASPLSSATNGAAVRVEGGLLRNS